MMMEMEMGKRQRAKGLFSVPFALCRWPPSAPPPTPLSQCQRSASPLAFLAPSSTALWSLRRRGLENERHGANHDAASQDQGRLKALATAWPAQTQSAPSTRMRRCWPNLVVVRCRHSVGSRRKRTRLWQRSSVSSSLHTAYRVQLDVHVPLRHQMQLPLPAYHGVRYMI